MADSEGRVGSVSRAVTAFQMDGAGVCDGRSARRRRIAGGAKAALEPAIEPAISRPDGGADGSVWRTRASSTGLEATLEILSNEDSPPLATMPMRIAAGASPEIATASAQFNTAALPPGRYLARGTLRQGGKAQGHMIRPFRIVADRRRLAAGGAPATAGAMPSEMAMVMLGGVAELRSQGTADAGDADVDVRDRRGAPGGIEGGGEGSARRRSRRGRDDRAR